MKKLSLSLGLALASLFTFSSCQDFPTVKVASNFEETVSINSSNTTFFESKLVDATTDSDFNKYKNKINSVDIERITYTVTNFGGPSEQILTTGKIEIGDEEGNNRITLHTMSNVNLPSVAGQETDITASPADLQKLQDYVRNTPNRFTTFINGRVNKGPVNMAINLKFYTKVKARIIGSN